MNLKKSSRNNRSLRRLERRNAEKNIDYALDVDDGLDSSPFYYGTVYDEIRSKSLDLPLPPSLNSNTSFRIDGQHEGETELLYMNLGLNGPDDLGISHDAWKANKVVSMLDEFPKSRLFHYSEESIDRNDLIGGDSDESRFRRSEGRGKDAEMEVSSSYTSNEKQDVTPRSVRQLRSRAKIEFDNGRLRSLEVSPRHVSAKQDTSLHLHKSTLPQDDRDIDRNRGKVGVIQSGVVHNGVALLDMLDTSRMTNEGDQTASSSLTSTDDSPNEREIMNWSKGRELGRGSFGTVYEAINHDGFFFAVKEVSLLDQGVNAQQSIQQLEQEIALLSDFKQDNIVRYLGTEKEEAKLYIFIDLVTQGSLASLYQNYRLQDSHVSEYTRQILNGLKDIKCANILVDANGCVKLADFGLAKQFDKMQDLKSCKGSVYWMAPEVVKPKQGYGTPADIWSLGCTVFEMLTGKPPYSDLEWTSALFKIGRGERPAIPEDLSTDARDFINQCVQVKPTDRPSSKELLGHPFVKK
ncbi:hypothetical protein ZOSMA_135G00450 [Zostera marina]|uniref:mitogen-activated protein kinase kinase kinase n=1 Tax=Zostera marina TaxID=29655 RepID=A0A0K9PYQ0_ZOSMR|nr:hypothetical protein ZOSMA_135G00450 [Zostera marina]